MTDPATDQARPGRVLERIAIPLAVVLIALFILPLVMTPYLHETLWIADTFFLANLGWRGVNELTPVLDYPHFYGGVMAALATLSMELFGVTIKALDYALILAFLGVAVLTVLLLYWRVSLLTAVVLLLLSASIILPLSAFERGEVVWPYLTHAFSYNHVAASLIFAMMGFGLFAPQAMQADVLGGLAAGVSLYLLFLLKFTFVIFAPALILVLLIQKRVWALAALLVGAAATMLLFDPGAERAIGAGAYSLSLAGDKAGGVTGLIKKVFYLTSRAQFQFAVLFAMAIYVIAMDRRAWAFLVQAGILFLGYVGAAITMGPEPGLQLAPGTLAMVLLFAEWLRGRRPSQAFAAQVIGCMLIGVVALAQLGNAWFTTMRGVMAGYKPLVAEGPLSTYVVHGIAAVDGPDARTRLEQATARVIEIKEAGQAFDESVEFAILAEGIAMLQGIEGMSEARIVSNGFMFEFSVPLGAPPVISFPLWAAPGSPAFDADRFARDVDVVMVADGFENEINDLVTADVKRMMADDFRACHRSQFWVAYIRKGSRFDCAD
ncbi:MAG: hypothetical protein AAF503_04855 [Pseudomonadota bacterium]